MNKIITLEEYKRLKFLENKAIKKGLIFNKDGTFQNKIDLFLSKKEYIEWMNLQENFKSRGLPLGLR
jgi:hypothetical protein